MKANVIVDFAKHGELRQLAVKDDNEAIISYLNLALIELYKRFNLSLRTEVIKTSPAVKVYTLRGEDINVVLDVYNSEGKSLTRKKVVNDNDYDITQINFNTFLLTNPKTEELMFLYKSAPKMVKTVNDDVELPYDMIEATVNYIAYKAHSVMNSNNAGSSNNNYYNKFNYSCRELEQRGYVTDMFSLSHNVQTKGFK